ncbi:MAG: thymidylate synthase [Nanopusillaceae archaeon]
MKKDIVQINKNSNIAISTLWSKKEEILKNLKEKIKEKIGIIGTTYTSYGINLILETLAKNPKIDTLILFGADLSSSGENLIKIFKNKDLKACKIIFPSEKVEKIVNSVKIIDLRKEFINRDFSILEKVIEKNYNENCENVRELIEINLEEESELNSWLFPLSGHYIYETGVFRAWIKILDLIMRFGSIKFSEHEEPQKEYLNVMVTLGLYGNDYKIEEEFFKYIPKKDFENHINQVLNPEKPETVEYTYGERIFKHRFGKNQLEYLIEKLSKSPYSRRALVVSWDHEIDQKSKNPPCIIAIQGTITENYYSHIVFLRSNDMYAAWPVNFIAQIELAKKIVNEINKRTNANFSIGSITSISFSAHIYEHDWNNAKRVINENREKLKFFVQDPKGNFLISKEGEKIKLEHRTPDNSTITLKLESENFWEIYQALKGGTFFSTFDHALYLGKELRNAFNKLKEGKEYIQDEA